MRSKLLYGFLIFLIFHNISYAADGFVNHDNIYITDAQDVDAKLDDLLEALDLNHMIKSISIHWDDWGSCGSNNLGLPGFAMCFDEPKYIGDYSKEPLKIHSLGVSLGSNPEKNGYLRTEDEQGLHGFGWVNLISFPIMGMILDAEEMCLEKGDISIGYLSPFDPTYDGIFSQNVFADITAMMHPETMLLGAIDCLSSSVSELDDPLSTFSQNNNKVRMALPHYVGCWNSFPMGGWSHNPDPILMGVTASTYALAMGQRSGFVKKTMPVKGFDDSYLPDTMCGPKYTAVFVKPQFLYTLASPGKSSTVPLGATAPEWAEFKNLPDSFDESAFWIWQRKCFYFGAAKCSKDD